MDTNYTIHNDLTNNFLHHTIVENELNTQKNTYGGFRNTTQYKNKELQAIVDSIQKEVETKNTIQKQNIDTFKEYLKNRIDELEKQYNILKSKIITYNSMDNNEFLDTLDTIDNGSILSKIITEKKRLQKIIQSL